MTATKEIRNKWKLLKEDGDIGTLAEQLDVSLSTVSRAVNGKKCTERVFKHIAAYFQQRESLLNEA